MTLYEHLVNYEDIELEIGDNTWDCITYAYWDDNFKAADNGMSDDWYNKFMVSLYRQCNIVKLYKDNAVVDIAAVVKKFAPQLEELQSSIWYPDYCYPKEDQEFEYQWVSQLCHYADGNVIESTAEKLYKIFNAERDRWLANHTVESD